MHVLGITKEGGCFQWVLAHFDRNFVIERMEKTATPPELSKNLLVVTGLEGTSVLRRDLKLPITNSKTILDALPFQLEPVLPYPPHQTVVYPQLHPSEKETFVVAWATTDELIQNHLNKWVENHIEPDFVSSETLALARWARFFFPQDPEIVVIYKTIGIALNQDKIVCAIKSSDPERLKFFLKQKYPLYTWIDQGPAEEVWRFAIPIGLALEPFQKQPCQFRSKDTISSQQKSRESLLARKALATGFGLILITATVAASIFYFRESKLKDQITVHHPNSLGPLETRIQSFRTTLIKALKSKPLVFEFPPTQDVLAWLSSLQTQVELSHFSYELTPAAKIQISLEFQAQTPIEADLFVKQLQQEPTFVESTQDLQWTSTPQGYKLSFALRKSS